MCFSKNNILESDDLNRPMDNFLHHDAFGMTSVIICNRKTVIT